MKCGLITSHQLDCDDPQTRYKKLQYFPVAIVPLCVHCTQGHSWGGHGPPIVD